ncbi:MAG: tRNA uridine-5-carboxymethylaminomethyl(34) synthesis GTPase MnmE [Tannerellaceae bacterium]|jgi:tRNA modification GTPase|nr:tRNA uridine-5-carboxymethylaminomethyl(34) synthesis GTPase MnmE [Tannerellaceae bacterium]
MNDTICAISTPPGEGGIAVIRISGPEAIVIASAVFFTANGSLSNQPTHTVVYGSIRDGGEIVDEALATVFRAPRSYTGDDTVELSCHGSRYVQQQTMRLLVEKGCRTALAGEFTQRAFLAGKMDLSQAEAVADLIASTSRGMHRLALNQMRGGFGKELQRLREQMLEFVSLIELELDFGEEDVEFADRSRLNTLASEIENLVGKLAASFNVGNAIKNGIPVAIIGETNAGKSTIMNLLVDDDRAIVSDIHGTTRDAIEDTAVVSGISFRFIDTAGIRETTDVIETIGIARTFDKLDQASIALWVIDLTTDDALTEALAKVIVPRLKGKTVVLLFNKADLLAPSALEAKKGLLPMVEGRRLYMSAFRDEDISLLKDNLVEAAALPSISAGDIVVTNVRHHEALTHAHSSIRRVIEGLATNIPSDLLSQDIRECLHHIGEITGHITSAEVLRNIFSRFCIGK